MLLGLMPADALAGLNRSVLLPAAEAPSVVPSLQNDPGVFVEPRPRWAGSALERQLPARRKIGTSSQDDAVTVQIFGPWGREVTRCVDGHAVVHIGPPLYDLLHVYRC